MPTRANRDTNSYGMNVDNGARAPHTEIEDRFCQNISCICTVKQSVNLQSKVSYIPVIDPTNAVA